MTKVITEPGNWMIFEAKCITKHAWKDNFWIPTIRTLHFERTFDTEQVEQFVLSEQAEHLISSQQHEHWTVRTMKIIKISEQGEHLLFGLWWTLPMWKEAW